MGIRGRNGIGPVAANLTKMDEEGAWLANQAVLCFLVDTIAETISLPPGRIEGARTIFRAAEHRPGNMHIRLRIH